MKSNKAFLGLIFIVCLFGIVKFFDLDKEAGGDKAQASLETSQESVQLGGDIFTGSYDNQVNSRAEILTDRNAKNYIDELNASSTSNTGSCFDSAGARYYLVKFADGGDVIASYGEENRWPIASISKLMSAVVASENMDLDKPIELTENMLKPEGTAGDLKAGEKYTGRDLLKVALLVSSNDAVEALAVNYGKARFVELMNKKAQALHMEDTFFIDPSGLSIKNQSTSDDIYRLVNYIANGKSDIFAISRTKSFDVINLQNNKKRRIYNMNEFAGQLNFIGGKTGFIPESGGNLVSVFDRNNQKLVVVVFDSQDRFDSTRKILQCIK